MSVEVLGNPTVSAGRKRFIPPESLSIQLIKALLYMVAFGAMHLWRPVATDVGLGAFVVAVIVASVLAQRAFRSEMRGGAVLLIGLGFAFVFQLLSGWVRSSTTIAPALGVDGAIFLSDILAAGLASLSLVFVLRFFAKRHRAVAILELCLVVLLASYALLEHRGFQINRPHWFADWIFSMGMDPVDLLKAFGVGLMVLGLVMALQRPGANKGWMSFIVASAIALAVFFYLKDRAAPAAKPAPTAGLLGEGEDGEAEPDEDDDGDGGNQGKDGDKSNDKGGGGGSGKSDSPFGKNNKRPPPQPVALVTFHDDFESKEPILYFRQNAQSRFDQTHLTVDQSGRFDDDLITRFPTSAAADPNASPSGPVAAKPRDPTFFKRVPTSMFLITDHPQPVTLGHAAEVRPLDNPNPNLFVASYEVTSDMMATEWSRLVGRPSVPGTWDEERRKHYTSYPDDPRYASLADEILRDIDPRYQDDDLVRAFAIKRYLEKNGFYTLKETHKDSTDPTASFLFGSLRGYCVHFAHAAVFLMRSQGIAARVAVGYAVDTARRGSGSSMLILGDMAHAWPEIHLDGVGWVTFDVYPEQSDEPPPTAADQDLASVLGEIARNDPSGGMAADPNREPFPWAAIGWVLVALLGGTIAAAYAVKLTRRFLPSFAKPEAAHRWALRSALDDLSDLGVRRLPGETRESFADRLEDLVPSLRPLTMAHLRAALGPGRPAESADKARETLRQVRAELRRKTPWYKRLAGAANPLGWWWSR